MKETSKQIILEECGSDVLDQTLSQFYAKVQNQNWDDYELDCLEVMQTSLKRYLKSEAYPKSTIGDREFPPERSWKGRPGNCQSKAKESSQPIQKFDKRTGKSPLAE